MLMQVQCKFNTRQVALAVADGAASWSMLKGAMYLSLGGVPDPGARFHSARQQQCRSNVLQPLSLAVEGLGGMLLPVCEMSSLVYVLFL